MSNYNVKQIVSIAVIAMMVMSVFTFTGCSSESEEKKVASTTLGTISDGSESIQATEEPQDSGFRVSNEKENIPEDAYFDDYTFTILYANPNSQTWTYTDIVPEELNEELLNDAFYTRNLLVEERLGVKFDRRMIGWADGVSEFTRRVQSGDNEIDAAFIRYPQAASVASSMLCADLNDVPFIDFSKPWWDKGSIRDMSIGGRNYFVASDITIGADDNTWVLYFNKKIHKDLGIEDLYKCVTDGKWTFDKFMEVAKMGKINLDGSGVMGPNDQWGFMSHSEHAAGLWIAAGMRVIGKDKNDMPVVQLNSDRFSNVWNKICQVLNNDYTDSKAIATQGDAFINGKTLFSAEILWFARRAREMETDFGILPQPKFEETQESYYTYVAESAPVLIVPANAQDLNRTGIILECLAAEGNRQILPAYYDVNLKNKLTRDEESSAMLDICYNTRIYDLSVVYNWGTIRDDLKNYSVSNNTGIVSLYESKIDKINSDIEKTITAYGLN